MHSANERPRGRRAKTALSAKQLCALRIDAASRLCELLATPASVGMDAPLPRGIGSAGLARMVGVSRRAVDHWRNRDPIYRTELLRLLAAPLLERLARGDRERPNRLPGGSTREGLARQRLQFIRENWPGHPVQSMVTGEEFSTPEAYAAHLAEHEKLLDRQLRPLCLKPVKPLPGIEYLRAEYEPPAEETGAEGRKNGKKG